MSQTLVTIDSLPIELTSDEAVEIAYREDLDWIEHKLRLGMSVLVDCDKQLTLYLYRNIRRRLRREPTVRCQLIAGQSSVTGEGPQSLMQAILAELREQVYSGVQDQILVLPHLDVLTTTTRSGLNAEAREAIAMVFENPNLVLLGFRDPLFEIPPVLQNVFAVRRELIGMPRESLNDLVTQREARKLGLKEFNPYTLYKFVSGINAVRFRQIMCHLHDRVDFSPENPQTAEDIYREIRQMTVISDLDLPTVNLQEDIGGYNKVKTQIEEEILTLLKFKSESDDAEEIRRIEEIIPKGLIFFGPPGTGKTYFAKAIATSLNATVTIISGPEMKSKWVGESEENIRRVFAQARRSAPSIIVFDELDSFATARGTYSGSGVEHSMVNQLLTEMDGFRKEELVFVVGTTNFSDSLDPALLRPGRFELLIEIPYPNREDRRRIIEIYREKFSLPMDDEQITKLVDKTGGYVDELRGVRFSGDHLYAICRALKREQLRTRGEFIVTEDAINKALNSRRKKKVKFSRLEERTIAIHEAGHAICAHKLPYVSAVEKITIATGDSSALGYVMREVKENKYITTKNELLDDICMLLGGRMAEQIIIGDISVGAYDDLQKATTLARSMVEELGMGTTIGLRTIAGREGVGRQATRENISDEVSAEVDREISQILNTQRDRCLALLTEHGDLMEKLIDTLLTEKTLDKQDVIDLLGPATRAARYIEDEESEQEDTKDADKGAQA